MNQANGQATRPTGPAAERRSRADAARDRAGAPRSSSRRCNSSPLSARPRSARRSPISRSARRSSTKASSRSRRICSAPSAIRRTATIGRTTGSAAAISTTRRRTTSRSASTICRSSSRRSSKTSSASRSSTGARLRTRARSSTRRSPTSRASRRARGSAPARNAILRGGGAQVAATETVTTSALRDLQRGTEQAAQHANEEAVAGQGSKTDPNAELVAKLQSLRRQLSELNQPPQQQQLPGPNGQQSARDQQPGQQQGQQGQGQQGQGQQGQGQQGQGQPGQGQQASNGGNGQPNAAGGNQVGGAYGNAYGIGGGGPRGWYDPRRGGVWDPRNRGIWQNPANVQQARDQLSDASRDLLTLRLAAARSRRQRRRAQGDPRARRGAARGPQRRRQSGSTRATVPTTRQPHRSARAQAHGEQRQWRARIRALAGAAADRRGLRGRGRRVLPPALARQPAASPAAVARFRLAPVRVCALARRVVAARRAFVRRAKPERTRRSTTWGR